MVPVSAGSPVVVGVDGSPYAVDAARVGVVERHDRLALRLRAGGGPGVDVVERVVVGEPAAVLIGKSRHAREVVLAARGLDDRVGDLLDRLRCAWHSTLAVRSVGDPPASADL